MPHGSTGALTSTAMGSRQEAPLVLARQAARAAGPGPGIARSQAQNHEELARAAIAARTALEEAASAAAAAAERALCVAEALDEALARLEDAESSPAPEPRDDQGPDSLLSPREREVLALVAEGRTNKAIADALFVSPNTIKTHVASLLHKLRVDTRVQLAALAARHERRGHLGVGAAPG